MEEKREERGQTGKGATPNSQQWRRSIKKMTSSRKVIPFFHARDEGHTVIRDVLRLMCYSQGSIFMAPLSSMEAQRPMIDGCSGVLLSLRVDKDGRRRCQEWSLYVGPCQVKGVGRMKKVWGRRGGGDTNGA